jgi:hypothetical protein
MRCLPLALVTGSLWLSLTTPGRTDEPQWVKLFNGTDLSGWRCDTNYWSVQDGAITAQTTPEKLLTYNTFCIWEGGEPANFQLRLKFRIVGGNSGVQYRSRVIDEAKYVVSGYQADIDSSPKYTGMNYEEKARTFLAQRGESVVIAKDGTRHVVTYADKDYLQKLAVRPEEWNDYLIVARGNHLQHFVNGVLTADVLDRETEKAAKSGVIALQAHQGPPMIVQFKDIELLEQK